MKYNIHNKNFVLLPHSVPSIIYINRYLSLSENSRAPFNSRGKKKSQFSQFLEAHYFSFIMLVIVSFQN